MYWFLGIWGSSANDVYAVGQPGMIAHFDGSQWSFQNSGTRAALTDVYSPDGGQTYYICGNDGLILRKSGGGGWSRMTVDTTADLYGLGSYGGDVYVTGQRGALKRLSGGTWVDAGLGIIVRDTNGAPIDTLDRREDVNNLTVVTSQGIAGFDGLILMDDDEWDWQRRLILGGRESIFAGFSHPTVTEGNFLTTNGGRIFQLIEDVSGLAWKERFSPSESFEAISGLWVSFDDPSRIDCFIANWGGEVIQETIETLPDELIQVTVTELLDSNPEFYYIWGAAPDDLFVCGKSLTLMRYYDPSGGDSPTWHEYEMAQPAKSFSGDTPTVAGKFGYVR
jgi:hypothetical protein